MGEPQYYWYFFSPSDRNDLPLSADGESRPLEPPLLPDIGEPHPCPYFEGRELNFIKPREEREKKKKEVSVLLIVPPVSVPILQPAIAEPVVQTVDEEVAVFESCLNECLHGITWEYLAQHSRDLSREMFCALISSNPRKYTLDKETANVLRGNCSRSTTTPTGQSPANL
ncbi:hypothetical protein CEXT_163251 [Caerostris extrusa]|uniref:Uncharacterized protein n=1 Tax=Caerostris extrusa TaxID=172846 RepID=A0AAV4Q104_CAEEX|nr:hypothetical protein CEXT_163251 [Caerostris extrusa]